MNIKNTIIEHYRKFFDLHAKGIALDEDDHLNIDWAEDLVKNCFIPNVSDWVAVSENKPEAGQWLLVYASSGRHIAWYNGFQFEDRADYNIEGVTHWMQIPEPPCT